MHPSNSCVAVTLPAFCLDCYAEITVDDKPSENKTPVRKHTFLPRFDDTPFALVVGSASVIKVGIKSKTWLGKSTVRGKGAEYHSIEPLCLHQSPRLTELCLDIGRGRATCARHPSWSNRRSSYGSTADSEGDRDWGQSAVAWRDLSHLDNRCSWWLLVVLLVLFYL